MEALVEKLCNRFSGDTGIVVKRFLANKVTLT